MGGIFMGFLYACLTCAVIILIAWVMYWVLTAFMGFSIDGNVLKWAQVVVGLLCLIVIVGWLLSALGGGGMAYRPFWHG